MTRPRFAVGELGIVFAIALVIRLAVVSWAWERVPPTADGAFYQVVAERIAQGDGYTWLWPDGVVTPAAHYPVGYPALLGGLYFVFGAHPGGAMILNALLGALGAAAATGAARLLAGEGQRWGPLVAGLLVALAPSLVAYVPALMTEAAVATGWIGVTLFALLSRRDPTRGLLWQLAGVLLLGATTLLRPQSILLAPVFALALPGPWLRRLGRAAAWCLGVVALCLPWTLRNCERMDRCVFVSANGGWNLLIGTFPEGQGAWVALEGARVPAECREVFEEAAKDECFGRAGERRIVAAPLEWLSLAPAKLRATFDHTAAATHHLRASGALGAGEGKWLQWSELVFSRLLLLGALVAAAVRLRPAGSRAMALRASGGGGGAGAGQRPRGVGNGRVTRSGLTLPGLVLLGLALVTAVSAWIAAGLLALSSLIVAFRERGGVWLVIGGATAATWMVHAVFFGAGRYAMVLLPLWALGVAVLFDRAGEPE